MSSQEMEFGKWTFMFGTTSLPYTLTPKSFVYIDSQIESVTGNVFKHNF